ncbi:colanic acid/amylovoran biosynthesis protein [Neobacillus niacini]|uniref:polysaccharide pyruvyl transferase family protein n=1 Tax=Neobacillus driksii TaxID=3035913 RepID=UPI0027848127|nr:polysaccharide pyruvyl transferase family protein [Neobacillus niacini]MDQ0975378.1 colanic acid/amylovoran biosynthesis protein [Neobacillus niacini]
MRKKNILVSAYYSTNLGDDLFLKILFDRYPNIEWFLLTSNDKYIKTFMNYNNVHIIKTLSVKLGKRNINLFYKLNEILLNFRKYDAFLNIGGSIFIENKDWKNGLKTRSFLPDRFKKYNKKTFIIGSNFGPFRDELFIERHKEFFAKFDDICFRDSYSYNLFRELENVRYAPDVVFNLELENNEKLEKCIGFSIIDLKERKGLNQYYNEYNEKVIQLVEKYVDLGYKIKFFSFCENEGDLGIINYIRSRMNSHYSPSIKVINYEGNIDQFLDEYKACEAIVGTRFHSIILALLLNQAVFPIIYSDKTYNVLKDLSIEDNCCYLKDIENLDINEVVSITKVNRLKDKTVFSNAARQFEKLDAFIR